MDPLTGKSPLESAVETRYLLMPNDTNPYGTAFGGVIMAWIDMVASMAAQRHAGREVVTAGMDSLSFKLPIRLGEQAVLRACVNYAGRTSMEVGVQVSRENPCTGEAQVATTAHLTFVAVDENHQPAAVPPIVPSTPTERRRYANAQERVEYRKRRRQIEG